MVSQEILAALACISPDCDYDTWLKIGMAIQAAGGDWTDWDEWSRQSSTKYHPGECQKKWRSFGSDGITESTLFYFAREGGYRSEAETAMSFDDWIVEERPILLTSDVRALPRVEKTPEAQLREYITTLFRRDEKISYCLDAFYDEKEGKWKPGYHQMTGRPVADILDVLEAGGTIEEAIGTPNTEAGAWVRFNPVSGEVSKNGGILDSFVTDYRYALVESDTLPIEDQYALIHKMELPVACLVTSGKKSLHAIVRVDAADEAEYKNRVKYLYDVCEKYGLPIDTNNKNPSRLSRMPGIMRGAQMQELVATNFGCATWAAWLDKIEDPEDTLPPITDWLSIKDHLPPLETEVIPGVLRQGHKMMVAAASKAGKSFLMIELAVALSEGLPWLGFQCRKSRVLYVNFEIAAPSFAHRVDDVFKAYGTEATGHNLQVWNLRGKSMSMSSNDKKKGFDKRLIQRVVRDGHYDVIIIDPIYKVLDGDENSAADIRSFCNSLDLICERTNCCAIYVHHHSKGSKWGTAAIDRASGSGVFGRDADATVDLIEIPLTAAVRERLPDDIYKCKGFMMSTDLREFEATPPRFFWFKHPLHVEDETGTLEEAAGQTMGTGETDATAHGKAAKKADKKAQFLTAVETLEGIYGRTPTPQEVTDYFSANGESAPGFSRRSIFRYFNEYL